MASPVKRNWEHTPDADVWLTWGILIHKGKAQNTDFGALVFELLNRKSHLFDIMTSDHSSNNKS